MKLKAILATAALLLLGWMALALAQPPTRAGGGPPPPGQHWDWYQGTRGQWIREGNRYRWHPEKGDHWYQGQAGHWYREPSGWQFGTTGLVCNNQGRNCRVGGYLPPNGEGMVSRTNPRMFWRCDRAGHNCGWAPRPM